MKKKSIAIALSLAMGLATFQGCIGSFGLTGKIYSFNKGLGNKWLQWIGFLVLCIVPIYEIGLLADVLIFNSLEFWTGSNPVAMQPGEKEVQYVRLEGNLYKIEATQNRFHVVQLEGKNAGATGELVYSPETNTWLVGNGHEMKKLAQQIDGTSNVRIFKKSGETVIVDSNATPDELYETLGF